MVGGTLAAGSANAINCYLDRDIDLLMTRTRRRPLPAHQVEPERAVIFGIVLGIVSFAIMAFFVNLLAAFLTLLAIAFYVVVYTMLLKRTTPQNIVIGGAAGALPPVIGWAAVTGDVGIPALILFALVFYWTPPHFWALSLRIRKDYAAAGVPMLPVVKGIPETTRQIGLYTLLMVAISLVLWPVAQMGLIYLGAAVGLGRRVHLPGLPAVAARRLRGGLDPGSHRPVPVLDQLPVAAVPGHRGRRARHHLTAPREPRPADAVARRDPSLADRLLGGQPRPIAPAHPALGIDDAEHDLDQRPDTQGEDHRAQPDRPAQRPADPQHDQLDDGPRAPDGPAEAVMDAGHQPIARSGPEVGREIQRTADGDDRDPQEHDHEANGQGLGRLGRGRRGQHGDAHVGRRPDGHDVEQRARPPAVLRAATTGPGSGCPGAR